MINDVIITRNDIISTLITISVTPFRITDTDNGDNDPYQL